MRLLVKLILSAAVLGLVAAGALAWLALADSPSVSAQHKLSHEDIARARELLRRHNPRRLAPGTQRTMEISQQDLDLAIQYLVGRLLEGNARVDLAPDLMRVEASFLLPPWPLPRHLNIDLTLGSSDGQAELHGLSIGRLPVPGWLAQRIARQLVRSLYGEEALDTAAAALQQVRIMPDRLELAYRWHPELISRARDTLLTEPDRAGLHYYLDLLASLQAQDIGVRGGLGELLAPLFSAALARSGDGDPVLENTALLTVLGTWAARRDTSRLAPNAPKPRPFRLRLGGRTDLAQHFLISAALAARGDSVLSDAVGMYKEISDGLRGSGFSFTDLAADRAGTRFGELASRSPADAQALQRLVAAGLSDQDILPPVDDLPEHLDWATFEQRYGSVDSPAFQVLAEDIEQRLDALPLYRP
jgi:hypothetical protein